MAHEFEGKSRISVEGLTVPVLGGRFHIEEIMLEKGQSEEEIRKLIEQTAMDRWFVMLSEGMDGEEDVLAIIDDMFEFQSIALGTLENE